MILKWGKFNDLISTKIFFEKLQNQIIFAYWWFVKFNIFIKCIEEERYDYRTRNWIILMNQNFQKMPNTLLKGLFLKPPR